jgi:hypothetical protein
MLMTPASSVLAGGPRIPRVAIAAQGERRLAGLLSYGESDPIPDGGCSGFIADGFGVVRKPVPVRAGRVTARLHVRAPERPDVVRVKTWRHVDEDGFPMGHGRATSFRLRRQERRWVVTIRPFVGDLLYGELFLRWRDHDGCEPDEGSWLFLLDPR